MKRAAEEFAKNGMTESMKARRDQTTRREVRRPSRVLTNSQQIEFFFD